MATLIGTKKLNTEQVLELHKLGNYSVSKGVYFSPAYKRNLETGEVVRAADKITTDYIIHSLGNVNLNRHHITKQAAAHFMRLCNKMLNDVPCIANY